MTRIMVVDNEPETTKVVQTILETEKFKVVSACSGEECLEKFEKGKLDLVILDVMMPELSGYDVFWRIRENDKETPIMFLTVIFTPEERIEEFKKQGLCAYLTKPFGPEELVKTVKECLGAQ